MTTPSPAVLEAARLSLGSLWLVVLPLFAQRRLLRLRAFTSRAIRIGVWREVMALSWAIALGCLLCAGALDPFAPTYAGVQGPALGPLSWPVLRLGLLLALVAAMGWQFARTLRCARDARRRMRVAPLMRGLRWMLPVTRVERLWWIAVSVTAGVTEEIVARGFLLSDLHGGGAASPLLHLPVTVAWIGSSLLFGFAHLYQGARGVLKTALGGLFMGALAILSGGLVLPIVVHALVDLQVLLLYQPEQDAREEAAQLVQGCALPV